MKIFWLLAFAMTLFSGNSILCRLALVDTGMDAQSYTIIRAVSASCALYLIVMLRKKNPLHGGSFTAAFALFVYMAGFSWGFLQLSAATGSLINFTAVQSTMIAFALTHKEKLTLRQIIGLGVAFAGLLALFLPGVTTPPLFSAIIMFCSGIGWGIYCLCKYNKQDPVLNTAGNFIRCLPFMLLLLPFAEIPDWMGFFYASLAGAGASAIGYITWYRVVGQLSTTNAAVVQLSVPIITSFAGVLFLGESISTQLLIGSVVILSGILFALTAKKS